MKVIGWILGLVLLAVVAVGVFVFLKSEDLVGDAIEKYGSQYLETDVSVSQVNLSLAEGSGEILGLEIDNPRGFDGNRAFSLAQIKLVLDPQGLSRDLIVLKEVVIDGADIGAVVRGKDTNLQALIDNLNRNTGAGEAAPADQASGPKLIIDRFRFTNATASVDSDLAGRMNLDIPNVYLKDVGRASNGATVGAVMQQVMTPIIRAVTQEMLNQGLDIEGARAQIEDRIRESVSEKIGGGLKGLTDKLRRPEE